MHTIEWLPTVDDLNHNKLNSLPMILDHVDIGRR